MEPMTLQMLWLDALARTSRIFYPARRFLAIPAGDRSARNCCLFADGDWSLEDQERSGGYLYAHSVEHNRKNIGLDDGASPSGTSSTREPRNPHLM